MLLQNLSCQLSSCAFPKKFNEYRKRLKKQSLLRNVGEFAERLFESSRLDTEEFDPFSDRGSSWFRPSFKENGSKKSKSRYRTSQAFTRDFEFCEDGDEVEFETIFRSAFGGTRGFFWSFTIDDGPHYRNTSSYSSNYRTSRGRKYQYGEDYDSSSDYESHMVDMRSDRVALGLAASGPLNVEDVKNAYRACALKWHPDRHQGSSKVVAEEKFKACSAAYQSLCDKLGVD
ncbi:Chaperone DnaJ-domain superfamily protein [Striga hermonthica]|uniref:Chaperone DnaJ-domain superfamily protein n=1 Tax=Striga hermonthica TaxID=68872 RepID=A0A9N7R422_STRHE|nr:Chaperone DnaJ-domain superfamily protein [Striga hermonthica]